MAKKDKKLKTKKKEDPNGEEARNRVIQQQRESLDALTHLGSKTTDYNLSPNYGILETFPNPADANYLINFYTEEFTSLCPKTGQPDFASVEIQYIPEEVCVESKSLKLYLFAYRNEGAFMEKICNLIADDLEKVLKPRWLRVFTSFAARGGIKTDVEVERGERL